MKQFRPLYMTIYCISLMQMYIFVECSYPHFGRGCRKTCNCSQNECNILTGCESPLPTSTTVSSFPTISTFTLFILLTQEQINFLRGHNIYLYIMSIIAKKGGGGLRFRFGRQCDIHIHCIFFFINYCMNLLINSTFITEISDNNHKK